MSHRALILWALIGCQAAPTPAQPSPAAEPALAAEPAPEPAAKKPAFPHGAVNVLSGVFKRFDGQDLGRFLWPGLHRFHGHLDQHHPEKGVLIGMALNYLDGDEEGDKDGELDVLLLSGTTYAAPKRSLRVATFTTTMDPPGPLELVASSADNGLRAGSEARYLLRREGGALVVQVSEGGTSWERRFRRLGSEWAMEPPRP